MNGSDLSPPKTTLADMPSWKSRRTARNCGVRPNLLRMPHRKFLLTVSNALVRSINARYRLECCSRHFSWSNRASKTMSIVLLFRRKPHWDSGITMSTTWVRSRWSITRARILPATDRREILLLLPQTVCSPLRLKIVTMFASFHQIRRSSSMETSTHEHCELKSYSIGDIKP